MLCRHNALPISDIIQLEWLYDRYHQYHFGPLSCCAHVTQQGPCQNPKWALNKGFRLIMHIPAPKFCAAQWPCLNFRQQRQWVPYSPLSRYTVRNVQALITAQPDGGSAENPARQTRLTAHSHKKIPSTPPTSYPQGITTHNHQNGSSANTH